MTHGTTATAQTFTETDALTGRTFSAPAYTEDGGRTWKWESNSAFCPLDACQRFGIPANLSAQRTALDAETKAFVAAYRKARAGRRPSAEERHEMRAAFGPGVIVVNVLTGRRTRT
jgi:hypothetical protein